ncbi:20S proteasome alpha/beta subunit [Paenibacillus cellulosilyticus]|uniref:20S proteasome alpha/beta subunit n=1 Tax=Paenibacillus cellulosilyticus TaxID=375489 RepID=A0A2V2YT76_9BACL|nr:hypothetical protein [Paenibacillus cellulosilyticus]PWW02517.1 20S proteasome alpha/beta subunit [Paenibacillus cellulosilyticus]QKS47215.1 hypothetical protein HUB94_22510 [Paenibacillus cellulosilyticus]
MSLCIAVNNPSNFVIIAGDGRTIKGSQVVSNNHQKLTRLTEHISIFISGVQSYCEVLRFRIACKVNEQTTIDEVAKIVQSESKVIHDEFIGICPMFYELNPKGAALATVVAFFDTKKKESGFIEYCHSDGFLPHFTKISKMTARGLRQEDVIDYLPKHFNPSESIQSILGAFNHIESLDGRVGGTIAVHVISEDGIDEYVQEMKT